MEMTNDYDAVPAPLFKIMKRAPKSTGFWAGTTQTLKDGGGGLPAVLQVLHAEEEAIVPGIVGASGFIVDMRGGTAVVIMSYDSQQRVDLEIRTQGEANGLLFTLMANKFIDMDRIPAATPYQTAWGDVEMIRWFRIDSAVQVALVIHSDTIWPSGATTPLAA
jgi:hypothetical protein